MKEKNNRLSLLRSLICFRQGNDSLFIFFLVMRTESGSITSSDCCPRRDGALSYAEVFFECFDFFGGETLAVVVVFNFVHGHFDFHVEFDFGFGA